MADIPALANYYRDFFIAYDRMGFSRIATPTARLMRDDGELFKEGNNVNIIMPHIQEFTHTYDITKALDNAANPAKWVLPGPVGSFGAVDISGQVMARPNAAVIPVVDQRIGYGMQSFHEAREKRLWSDGSGSLGKCGTVTGAGPYTIACDIDTFFAVPPNSTVVFNPNRTGNAGTIRAGTFQVTGKHLAGDFTATITVAVLTGVVAPTLNDYIFIDGTYGKAPGGILAFLPATAPTSGDSFYSQDRSNYPELLSGWRFNYEGTIKGTIIRSFSVLGRLVAPELVKGRLTMCLSAQDWARLQLEMEGQVRYDPDSMRKFGTNAIIVETHLGPVPCITIGAISDTAGIMYGIAWDSWHNAPVGTVPHIMQDDGLVFARIGQGSTAQDAVEMRLRAYDMTFCSIPAINFQCGTK